METLGLYVSIPFCRSKCTYCNFSSGVFPLSYFERYVERLEADLHAIRERAGQWDAVLPERVDSIYLGGGTPSLLPAGLMGRLLAALRSEFAVDAEAEITVECAPGQIEDATLEAMAKCGVNRVSFGVQSFIDEEAKHTGRLHTRAIALRDVERVRQAGIGRVNLDLIAGLPGQTRASWRESLAVLCGAEPDHASVYMLEVDDDSRLGREIGAGGLKYYAPQVPADDGIADMYSEAVEFLAANGLPQYEISNFARAGSESRHNLKYWQRQPYLGLGLDAHSMLRDAGGHAIRFATSDDLEPFLESPGWDEPERLTPEEELEEAWFLGLRLNAGVSLSTLGAEFREDAVRPFETVLAELAADGLMEREGDRVRLTAEGQLLSNEVFARFLAEPVSEA
ncbi:MAG TPA: radical SAM family heme chaperone HemW [Acidobacteriaceae bacterium]|nr:radical SAM family heme chaperone HemW [Acidobacteriaceae bacterium]